jgi:hypothetical protein
MAPRFTAVALVGLAVAVGACDQPSPAAPVDVLSSAKPAPSSDFACVFSGNPSLSNSANSYFTTNDDRRAAADLISAMQTYWEAGNTALARQYGFALLTMVGQVSRGTVPVDRAVGDLLTKQAFNCMYETGGADAASFEGWPDDPHYDFETALDADSGGAYFVRGGESDPATAPAVGNIAELNTSVDPAGGNVSAIAPPATSNWSAVLGQQVLFFGEPVEDGYDWKVLPRDATFSPFARVALCQGVNGGGQEYADADMVHQFGVGVLGFIDGDDVCGTTPPFAALQGRGVLGRLARLGRSLGSFLSLEPLHASLAVAATRSGSVSGAKGDEFTFTNEPGAVLAVTVGDLLAKNTLKVNTGRFSVTVVVTTSDGEPFGGVNVGLTVTNNNGTSTNIYEVIDPSYTGCDLATGKVVAPLKTTLPTIDVDGTTAVTKAVWDKNLCITSTGAIIVNASSVAAGNNSAGLGTGKAATKLNVKP